MPLPLEKNRRDFIRLASGLTLGAMAGAGGATAQISSGTDPSYDYIVVGSGAGGAPLAARLARAGFRVLVLEAGRDKRGIKQEIPAFHTLSSEDPDISWNFFVQHYSDKKRRARDSKYVAAKDGILYPRAATIGGCTAHHAMIHVYPHSSDFDSIAEMTGDASWSGANMRPYFQRVERADYVDEQQDALTDGRHGFEGWLHATTTDPGLAILDPDLLAIVIAAASQWIKPEMILKHVATLGLKGEGFNSIRKLLSGPQFDPNHWAYARYRKEGLVFPPQATREGRRHGPREYLLRTQEQFPERLHIKTGALVHRVLFAEKRAVGVSFLAGQHLYEADPAARASRPFTRQDIFATREVILSGGAFNTPQLLMLSGIGPRGELERLGIPVRAALEGVGRNLQDRYEVPVISQMPRTFSLTSRCSFGSSSEDACLEEFLGSRQGVYTSNGVTIGLIKRSSEQRLDPDLFIFGAPTRFSGYYPGYAAEGLAIRDQFTWLVLKAHTSNTAGTITLKSDDPRAAPIINFRYFDEGNGVSEDDLNAVMTGVREVRRIMQRVPIRYGKVEEVWPGPSVQTDEELRRFIEDEAWGHHASCTARIGPRDDPMAVVDSSFRVHGVERLRVVDASVFPKIPGFFIAAPIYMISEKAADAIIATADAQQFAPATWEKGW